MKNGYPRRNGMNILNVMGFGFAIILTIGYMKSNGYELKRSDNFETPDHIGVASMSMDGAPTTSQKVVDIKLGADKSGDYDSRDYNNTKAYSNTSSKTKASTAVRKISNPARWVERFSDAALSQAVSRGVPAGLSLAVGLQQLEQGATILSWSDFVEKVVDPLAKAKQGADNKVRSNYFKYSANSDLWAEGLDVLGKHSERKIQATIQKYGLAAYDNEVRKAVISGRQVDNVTEEKASYVAEEVTADIRMEKRNRPQKATVAIGRNAADQMREKEEEAYFDEFVGREVARGIAKEKLQSGKYIGEEDMNKLILETNDETAEVVKNKLTFAGRKINKKHADAEKMLDITKKENAAAREELYQKKLKENKLDSRSRTDRKHRD